MVHVTAVESIVVALKALSVQYTHIVGFSDELVVGCGQDLQNIGV